MLFYRNWNIELKYLNLSGNKRLEITPNSNAHNQNLLPFDKDNKRLMGSSNKIDLPLRQQASSNNFNDIGQDQYMNISLSQRKSLSNFSTLTNLNMLGLMDVTCLVQTPDENDQRRVRTTTSDIIQTGIPGGIKYGVSDTLCRFASETNRRDSIYISREQASNIRDSSYFANSTIGVIPKEKYFLGIWDVVIPQFRNMDNESLFGIFDGRGTEDGTKLAEYLFRLFAEDFQAELKKVEESVMKENGRNQMKMFNQRSKESVVLDSNSIKCAIRRTFLGLNKDLFRKFKKMESNINNNNNNNNSYHSNSNEKRCNGEEENTEQFGCSAVIVYAVSNLKKGTCSLYIANVGDSTCILSKTGGRAQVISRLFKTSNVMDWTTSKFYNYNQKINYSYPPSPPHSPPHSPSYSSSTFEESNFIPGLTDEMKRIQNADGWITKNNFINGKTAVTRAFGYFDCLGSLNANPWIEKVEFNLKNNDNEFLVLVNGAVVDAFNSTANTDSGSSLSTFGDTAQKIVNIARSTFFNKNQKHRNRYIKTTTDWRSVANKIRDIALSHDAYGARNFVHPKNHNPTVKSSNGMMVMVIGLNDLLTNTPNVF